MKKLALVAVLATSALMAGAPAQYMKCQGCHGAHGEKKALGKSKIIKNFTKKEIVAAIKGYQKGTYGGPMKGLMKGQVAGLNDAAIKAIADYIGK